MASIPVGRSHRQPPSCDRGCRARQIARAFGGFELRLLGRTPRSVTVVGCDGLTMVTIQTGLSEIESRLAATDAGRRRLLAWHRSLVEVSFDALREHLHAAAGIWVQTVATQIDFGEETLIKTSSTAAAIDVVVLGGCIPGLGAAVDEHVRADNADGFGSVRYGTHPEGSQTMKKVPHVGVDEKESRECGDRST